MGGSSGSSGEANVESFGRSHCWQDVKTSVWNCDGETIHDTAVEVKMHRKVRNTRCLAYKKHWMIMTDYFISPNFFLMQILHMFGSGIPDPHDMEAVTPGCEESQSDCYDFSTH